MAYNRNVCNLCKVQSMTVQDICKANHGYRDATGRYMTEYKYMAVTNKVCPICFNTLAYDIQNKQHEWRSSFVR